MPRLSIIVPLGNEAQTIEQVPKVVDTIDLASHRPCGQALCRAK